MQNVHDIYLSALIHAIQQHPVLKTVAGNLLPFKEATLLFDEAEKIARGGESKTSEKDYLQSIFPYIPKVDKPERAYFFAQNVLSVSEDFFPMEAKFLPPKEDILSALSEEIAKLVKDNNLTADRLLTLLEIYTTQMPSGNGEVVSFYDYAKLLAGAAVCISKNEGNKNLVLIGVAISGVQSYLYDIVSKKASVNLKGRSLYLQVLPDLVQARLLHDLDLCTANVIYASAGNLYILAPEAAKNELGTLRKSISDALFEAHGTTLYLELAHAETSADELANKANDVFKRLHDNMAAQKRHKFSEQILDAELKFFEPIDDDGELDRDALTNEIIRGKKYDLEENLREVIVKAGDKKVVGELTKTLMINAENLQDHNCLVISEYKGDLQPFKGLKYNYSIVNKPKNSERAYNLREIDSAGFRFMGGNDYPKIELHRGEKTKFVAKTFSELGGAKETENDRDQDYVYKFDEAKFKRIGVLRMDVDGLGTVFIDGFPSLTRYMVLSRNLDYFFKGRLNQIWENGFQDDVQIIYAGGDDLFAVGKWDKTIEFAKTVRGEFKEWVCENPCITISGGVAIVTPKFPIIKGAKFSEDAEKAAKKHEFGGKKKNAFSMAGVTMNWDGEFELILALKDKILELSDSYVYGSKALPRSFLFKVSGYYEASQEKDKITQEKDNLRWKWQMAYDLGRMRDRYKVENDDMGLFLKSLIVWTVAGQIPTAFSKYGTFSSDNFFKLLNIACIWASYELRAKDKS